ncbi:hypothetical protein [Cryobacterium tagatosivorans]|uniref:Uncharacterized protein n=1 Tax=Cryobacterium tagatosivorans TaxID=1259199 RepID=A0A4R8UAY7_9MICO|nr:hypothetical protein [Cryobacterium tagatosivorans]TFB46578.1 hypothetical protein E3O23_17545 [Cryobacterium tagatosivorans]
MTLGNSPQPPLTRRQERELARQQASAPAEQLEQPEIQPAPGKRAVVAESVPVSAFAPRGTEPAPAEKPMTSAKRQAPERTLTRRQLRAIKAAESGETVSADVEDVAPDAETHTTGGLNPPVGHWSVDRGEDEHTPTIDPGQTFDQFMSRGTGGSGSPTTTSALILPSIPQQGSSSGPLTSTGEILITGSYDLPRSLGSTGHHPGNFDSSDIDQTDDHDDAGYNSTVAPVSASRAVSTHASNRGLVAPPQKSGNSLPTVLAVTAAVLAAGVLALFVLGYVFNIF